eukprot:403371107
MKLPSYLSMTQRNFNGISPGFISIGNQTQRSQSKLNLNYNESNNQLPKIDNLTEIKIKKPKVKLSKELQNRILEQIQQLKEQSKLNGSQSQSFLVKKQLHQSQIGQNQLNTTIGRTLNNSIIKEENSISLLNQTYSSQSNSPQRAMEQGSFPNTSKSQYMTKYQEKFIEKTLRQKQTPQNKFIQGQYPKKTRCLSLMDLANGLKYKNIDKDLIDKMKTLTQEREVRILQRYQELQTQRQSLSSGLLKKTLENRETQESHTIQKIHQLNTLSDTHSIEKLIGKKFMNSQERQRRKLTWLKNETDRKYGQYWDYQKQQKLREVQERNKSTQYKYLQFIDSQYNKK